MRESVVEGPSFIPWLQDAPFPAILCAMDGQVLLINEAAHHLLGVSPHHQVCSVEEILVHAGTWGRLLEGLANMPSVPDIRVEMLCVDGSSVPVRMALQRLGEEADRLVVLYPQVIRGDEIELDRLRREEIHLRTLVENVHEVIWEINADLNFTYISPMVRAIRGRAQEDYLGRNVREIVPPQYLEAILASAATRTKTGQSDGKPFCIRVKEESPRGGFFWTEITSKPIVLEGVIVGYLGSSRDVTDQKMMEDALLDAKGRLEALLKALPDMHFEVDANDKIIWYNITGASSPYLESPHLKVEDVLSADAIYNLKEARENADRTGKGEFRYSLPGPKGPMFFEAYVTSVAGSKPSHLFAVRDITETVKMTEALRQANHRISLLGHITRHDLINSMTVAEGNVRLCLDDPSSPKLCDRMEKVAKALREMRGLIIFHKEYQDEGIGESSWIDLTRLIVHEAQVLEAAGMELVAEKGVEVYVDPMFRKVIRNILENASKHSVSAKECRVSYREAANGLDVIIEDDGQGIPEKFRPRLFQRGQGSNTGLGLYLSREILAIDGMGLEETSSPGQGARFVLHIPSGRYRFKEVRDAAG